MDNRHFAIVSGICASAASMFGKLSGLPTFQDVIAVRILFFSLMLACNAAVWTFYVKALQASNSSLSATVTSAATNYLLSAISGFLIFGEVTSLIWWAGAGLVLLGLILIVTESEEDMEKKKMKTN
ncbi:PREDICTED: transmembrane protein 42 [Nicrophorus vespilloides]|uniref:Transmembrane protein 42 n=1 Tax=Nicrophorus vespilloides TaxID=110193 RepID=A0ABM1MQ44_NICVS|nr:PREDICTED: transmembrane protein 42 [Nicrophorus vespilloides]